MIHVQPCPPSPAIVFSTLPAFRVAARCGRNFLRSGGSNTQIAGDLEMNSQPLPEKRKIDPKPGEVAGGGESPYDGGMETRVEKLEANITAIKIDVAVIAANGATKADIAELRAATKADIAALGAANRGDIAPLGATTKADITKARADTKAVIAKARAAIRADIAAARAAIQADIAAARAAIQSDIAAERSATKAEIVELRSVTQAAIAEARAATKTDIAEAKTSIIVWVVGAIFLSQLLPSLLRMFSA